jgi:glycogen(starch) synthase
VSAAIRRWQADNDIDLLHLNGGPGGVLLAAKPAAPTIYTAHHTYAQQVRHVPGQSWKRPLAALEARSYGYASVVTAVSRSTADSVLDELGVDPAKVTVIPNGFDPETFRPVRVHQIGESVLYVGRLDARKGFQFLIEAWARAVEVRRGPRLFVVGRGPLQRWAESYLEARRLLDSVAFLGRLPEQELVAWYNRVDAVAVPSRFEGFGLSALEAIACGTPVVATDVEGLRDVVLDGIDGTLVSFGDVEGYAQALTAAVGRRARVSAERLEQVQEQYRWPRIAGLYLDAYRRTLSA